jgi:iron complex outermembrane receptor protein
MPNLNYSIGFSYDLPFAPGLTLTAGRRYTGWRQADPANQAQLPGVSVANLGLRYATKINGRKFEMGVNATNLLDKRYLSSSINGNLGVGAPRSITFTTRYDVGP